MIKKVKSTKIGDIFEVKISNTEKKYMQYIVSDLTQLNSDVVRVFSKSYGIDESPDNEQIISDDVDFYAHCSTKLGIKMNAWYLYGNIQDVGTYSDIIFRDSEDYGNPQIKVSDRWYVWHVNEGFRNVGKLVGENRNSYIGIVFSPNSMLEYIRHGVYQGIYPRYE